MTFVSSPYIFDEGFYHHGPILNGDIDAETATYGATHNRHKKYMRRAYEEIIDSTVFEGFTSLEMSDPPRLLHAHLPDSCKVDDPASFFKHFFRDEDFELIVTNTNNHAKVYPSRHSKSSQRLFKPTNRAEIKV
jgi:hypothetical protein